MKYRSIDWHEFHSTLIRWDTRGRRSRRTRRLWRAARRGDLHAAWSLMVGNRYKLLPLPGEPAAFSKLARPILVPVRAGFDAHPPAGVSWDYEMLDEDPKKITMITDGVQTRRVQDPTDEEVAEGVSCSECGAPVDHYCLGGGVHESRCEAFEVAEVAMFAERDRATRRTAILKERGAGGYTSCRGEPCGVCNVCHPAWPL